MKVSQLRKVLNVRAKQQRDAKQTQIADKLERLAKSLQPHDKKTVTTLSKLVKASISS